MIGLNGLVNNSNFAHANQAVCQDVQGMRCIMKYPLPLFEHVTVLRFCMRKTKCRRVQKEFHNTSHPLHVP